jgi:hypothetical protein
MKKLAIVGLLSMCAAGAYAQGTLVFASDVPNTVVAHIYSPNPASPSIAQTGASSIDFPAGTTVYGGTLVGGSSGAAGGPINYSFGNNFSAQIFAVAHPSAGVVPFTSLSPVSQYITTLSTTASPGAGFIVQVNPAADSGIPNTGIDANTGNIDNRAVISLAVWYNAGGTISSYAAAVAANVPIGNSVPFNLNGLGEPASVETAFNGAPTAATPAKNMGSATTPGLTSFSLTSTPEPSTIALGLMGVCAFFARRRKS